MLSKWSVQKETPHEKYMRQIVELLNDKTFCHLKDNCGDKQANAIFLGMAYILFYQNFVSGANENTWNIVCERLTDLSVNVAIYRLEYGNEIAAEIADWRMKKIFYDAYCRRKPGLWKRIMDFFAFPEYDSLENEALIKILGKHGAGEPELGTCL